ncbi:MAG: homoserine dehydrogenase [Candidatus Omnitrophota bacterium]|nr:MAG: homoserine dehydrogenase [Candidatus Omnitrophota bacterium]
MQRIDIGLVGFGTVGSGVVKVLKSRGNLLKKKLGIRIHLKKICDTNLRRRRIVQVNPSLLTRDIRQILDDPQIKIVVELIGGIHPAKEFIIQALRNKKHVVTANKALLAECAEEIFEEARRNNVRVYFEASVGGGIPIIKSLRESLISNRLQKIYGIVNGTSNYILSQMAQENWDFRRALKVAHQKGYAEKRPSLDLKGIDSAHKLVILAALGFGRWVPLEKVYIEGITDVSLNDIRYAQESGYTIKLLAIAKCEAGELELRVQPTLIPREHLLSSVNGIYNAIYVSGDLVGEQVFYGEGAGRFPTASAVIGDIADLAYALKQEVPSAKPQLVYRINIRRIRKIEEIASRYYIRFMAIDRPGVLAKISGILGQHKISISSVSQKERKWARIVPIVMMTHEASERSLRLALRKIDRLESIRRKTVALRVEAL